MLCLFNEKNTLPLSLFLFINLNSTRNLGLFVFVRCTQIKEQNKEGKEMKLNKKTLSISFPSSYGGWVGGGDVARERSERPVCVF